MTVTTRLERINARQRVREYAELLASTGTPGNREIADDLLLVTQHSDQSEASAMPHFVKVPAGDVKVVADALSQIRDLFPHGILVLPEGAEAIAIQGDR